MKPVTRFLTTLILVISLVWPFATVNSQDFDYESDTEYQKYLDDGKFMGGKNIIGINTYALFSGFASVNYTRKITDYTGVMVFGELHLFQEHYAPWIFRRYPLGYDVEAGDRPVKGGYGYGVHFNYYLNAGAIDNGAGVGLFFRQRTLKSVRDMKLISSEFCVSYTTWLLYGKRFALGGESYFGGAVIKGKNGYDTKAISGAPEGVFDSPHGFAVLLGLQLKVGIFI